MRMRVMGLVVVLVMVACSSDTKPQGTAASASGSSSAPTSSTAPPAPGLPAFYGVPDPLPAGQPGDVIKTETVASSALHGTLLRVMYHSRSIQDRDIPVTGLIAIPSKPPPSGGYPVIP